MLENCSKIQLARSKIPGSAEAATKCSNASRNLLSAVLASGQTLRICSEIRRPGTTTSKLGQTWPRIGECCQTIAGFGPTLARVAPEWRIRAGIGQVRRKLAEVGPSSLQKGRTSCWNWRTSPNKLCSSQVPDSANLAQIWSTTQWNSMISPKTCRVRAKLCSIAQITRATSDGRAEVEPSGPTESLAREGKGRRCPEERLEIRPCGKPPKIRRQIWTASSHALDSPPKTSPPVSRPSAKTV